MMYCFFCKIFSIKLLQNLCKGFWHICEKVYIASMHKLVASVERQQCNHETDD
jgi:hypothetical protein